MTKYERMPEGYEDRLIHLATRPRDALAGWLVVCLVMLGIVLGFGISSPRPDAEVAAGGANGGRAPLVGEAAEAAVPLAEQIGMSRRRVE